MYEAWVITRWETPVVDVRRLLLVSLVDARRELTLLFEDPRGARPRWRVRIRLSHAAYRNVDEGFRTELWRHLDESGQRCGCTFTVEESPRLASWGTVWIEGLEHYVIATEDDVLEVLSLHEPVWESAEPAPPGEPPPGKSTHLHVGEDDAQIRQLVGDLRQGNLDVHARPLEGRQLKAVERLDYAWRFVFSDDLSVTTQSLWRLIDGGRVVVTAEDDGHRFGLPEAVDAAERARSSLVGRAVESAGIAADSGDLRIGFLGGARLELLQSSCGYESWQLRVAGTETICTGGGKIVHVPHRSAASPVVEAEVTLLSTEEGGWVSALRLDHAETYRPHAVVGDVRQRSAIVGADGVTLTEEYLGVQFRRADLVLSPGSSGRVCMDLMYYPQVTYERLLPGATFTIREGPQVVGYGKVLRRSDSGSL